MPTLGDVASHLTESPHVTADDLDGVQQFINELSNVLAHSNNDVSVDKAVLRLTNDSGYEVGHLVYTNEWDAFRFIPGAGGEL